jgi:hypothetical protein
MIPCPMRRDRVEFLGSFFRPCSQVGLGGLAGRGRIVRDRVGSQPEPSEPGWGGRPAPSARLRSCGWTGFLGSSCQEKTTGRWRKTGDRRTPGFGDALPARAARAAQFVSWVPRRFPYRRRNPFDRPNLRNWGKGENRPFWHDSPLRAARGRPRRTAGCIKMIHSGGGGRPEIGENRPKLRKMSKIVPQMGSTQVVCPPRVTATAGSGWGKLKIVIYRESCL